MRQFVIDDLTVEELAVVDNYLKRTAKVGPIDGMFWLPVPPDLHGGAQEGHEDCGPFYFGIEVHEKAVTFELLVRSQSNLHCSCITYATPAQREFLLGFVDRMLSEEAIKA